MARLRVVLSMILMIAFLGACKTVHIRTHNPPGHAYGHKKHRHSHGKCGHWFYDGHWHERPASSRKR